MARTPVEKQKSSKIAEKALLRAIIASSGGATKLANAVRAAGFPNFHPQNWINWRNRGEVPLRYVPRLARFLGVSEYALNYRGVTELKGEAISFEEVVESCTCIPAVKRRIQLRKASPVTPGPQKDAPESQSIEF